MELQDEEQLGTNNSSSGRTGRKHFSLDERDMGSTDQTEERQSRSTVSRNTNWRPALKSSAAVDSSVQVQKTSW